MLSFLRSSRGPRGGPGTRAILFAIIAVALFVVVVVSGVNWIRDNGDGRALAAAAKCGAGEVPRAATTPLQCRAEVQAVTLDSNATFTSDTSGNFPLNLEIETGDHITARLISKDDFVAFDSAPLLNVTIWRQQVMSVDLGSKRYDTKDDPGYKSSQDLLVGGVCLLVGLGFAVLAVLAQRQARRISVLRAKTAQLAYSGGPAGQPRTGPAGFGRPPETWGGRPAQPGWNQHSEDTSWVDPGETRVEPATRPRPAHSPADGHEPAPQTADPVPQSDAWAPRQPGASPQPEQPGGPVWESH